MRPTLYADDLIGIGDSHISDKFMEALEGVKGILPLGCPGHPEGDYGHAARHSPCVEVGNTCEEGPCPICDGRGFLYPDPPDWYGKSSTVPQRRRKSWHGFCMQMWRAMGILEEET